MKRLVQALLCIACCLVFAIYMSSPVPLASDFSFDLKSWKIPIDSKGCGCQRSDPGCKFRGVQEIRNLFKLEAKCVLMEQNFGVYDVNFVSTEFQEIYDAFAQILGSKGRVFSDCKEQLLKSLCGGRRPDMLIMGHKTLNKLDDDAWVSCVGKTPVFFILDDMHRGQTKRMVRANEVLGFYTYLIPKWMPERVQKEANIVWVPHAAGRSFLGFNRPNASAVSAMLISGQLHPPYYPCRYAASLRAKTRPNDFAVLKHPDDGYRGGKRNDYAGAIRKYKYGLATTYNSYLVSKIFEIMATGAATFIDMAMWRVLRALGMEDRQHFFGFDCNVPCSSLEDLYDRISAKEHTEWVETVRTAGMTLIREKHTVFHRAVQIYARLAVFLMKEKHHNAGICFEPKGKFPSARHPDFDLL